MGAYSAYGVNIDGRIIPKFTEGKDLTGRVPRYRRADAAQAAAALARAIACHGVGDAANAERALRAVLKHDPDHAQALHGLADLLAARGEHRQAAKQLERLVARSPDDEALHIALAQAWLHAGELAAAAAICRRLVARGAQRFEALCLEAEIAERRSDWRAAIKAYEAAAASRPAHAGVHVNRGLAERALGRQQAALAAFEQALARDPTSASAWNNRGNAERDLRLPERAVASYTQALRYAPALGLARFNRGLAHLQLGEIEAAEADFVHVLKAEPTNTQAALQLAETRIAAGDFVGADALLESLLDRDPGCAQGWYLKAQLRRYADDDSALSGGIERLLRASHLDEESRTSLEFARGKLYDDGGDYLRAFEHFERGNRLRQARTGAEARRDAALLQEMIAIDPSCWQRPALPPAAGPRIVFIVGMPRSGTTLVEQILAAHPQVAAAGEVDFFGPALSRRLVPDEPAALTAAAIARLDDAALGELRRAYLERLRRVAGAAPVITDKTPSNFAFLGLLRRLFPTATFVHCRRHPLDTCLSIYQQLFGSLHYANDLDTIAEYYSAYRALMRHWRGAVPAAIVDLRYEALVAAPESVARALLDACELPWDARCLTPDRADRAILTASRWQARQPVYRRAVQRWRHYAAQLTPLLETWPELGRDDDLA